MLARFLIRKEKSGGLHYDLSTDLIPSEVGGIHLRSKADSLTAHDKITVLHRHFVAEGSVYGIVLQHVSQILRIEEVIDPHYLNVIREFLHGCTENHTSYAAEPIDTDFNFCHSIKF